MNRVCTSVRSSSFFLRAGSSTDPDREKLLRDGGASALRGSSVTAAVDFRCLLGSFDDLFAFVDGRFNLNGAPVGVLVDSAAVDADSLNASDP